MKTIYLTFDDGPNEPYTSQVLKLLGDFNAKATFFVCGANAEKNPQSLKNIIAGGHDIGIHSYSHNMNVVLSGGKKLKEEILRTQHIIFKATGKKTFLYRSPKGLTVPWIKPWLSKNGFSVFHWSIMAFDWWQPKAEFIANHIVKRAFEGAIVLLHDGDETKNGSRDQTVKALPEILLKLSEQGYAFKTLPEHYKHHITKDYAIDLALGIKYKMGF